MVGSAFGVRLGDLCECRGVDDPVEVAVPASVQPVAFDPPAAGLDGCCPVGHSVTRFRREPRRVAGLRQDLRGTQCGDTADSGEGRFRCVDSFTDFGFKSVDLTVQTAYACDTRTHDSGSDVLSPRSSLTAALRPLAVVSEVIPLWYPQRIFIRSLCKRLTAAVRSLTNSRR